MTTILDTPHEVSDIPGATDLQITDGSICMDNVSFGYHNSRTIIDKFTLHIAPKEKVAIIGPSGAGKSTIIKLLMRNSDVLDGSITVDGQQINKLTLESLWTHMSLVPQEPILFHRSLMENIRYGRINATDEEVIAAAKLAHCDEFIRSFADGYETLVGERGIKLSGGERQRVAIARAILRNAPILILDEATSSLDSESERLIQDALAHLMSGKTVIVIAHRLSTIMHMDRIVVMENGRIAEEGSHRTLLSIPDGLYRKLWQLQAGGFIA
jgi:ABC-type multidrug transport system fused ATPase/permease subunit